MGLIYFDHIGEENERSLKAKKGNASKGANKRSVILVRLGSGRETKWKLNELMDRGKTPYSWSSCAMNVSAASFT